MVSWCTDLATDDMGYLHEMIVNHIRKMISRKSIRFHEHKILLWLLLLERAIDSILELWRTEATRVQSNDMSFALGSSLIRLRTGNGAACSWVGGGFASVVKSTLLGLEDRLIAETTVGRAVVD
jgi:hypothetical protein